MKQELQQHKEAEQAWDGEISELKALVEILMGQVYRTEKASDPIPEASPVGGWNPPPPPG